MHNEYRSVVSSTTKQVTNRKQSAVSVMGLGVSTKTGYQSEKAYSPGSTTDSYRRWVNERLSDSEDNSDHERSDSQHKNVYLQMIFCTYYKLCKYLTDNIF